MTPHGITGLERVKSVVIMHCCENHKSHTEHVIKSLYQDYTHFHLNITLCTATYQQKVTKRSYRNCSNCCPPCSIYTSHLLSTDLQNAAPASKLLHPNLHLFLYLHNLNWFLPMHSVFNHTPHTKITKHENLETPRVRSTDPQEPVHTGNSPLTYMPTLCSILLPCHTSQVIVLSISSITVSYSSSRLQCHQWKEVRSHLNIPEYNLCSSSSNRICHQIHSFI
jgi:hypothetical protein